MATDAQVEAAMRELRSNEDFVAWNGDRQAMRGALEAADRATPDRLLVFRYASPTGAAEVGIAIGGRFDGWLMRRHPDGQWVSVSKFPEEDPYAALPDFMRTAPEQGR